MPPKPVRHPSAVYDGRSVAGLGRRRKREPDRAPFASGVYLAEMPPIADHRQWWAALLFGLMLLLLLLIASWLLRTIVPVAPAGTLALVQMPALPAPPDPPDPTPGLRASLDDAQTDEKKLNSALAAL